MPALRQAPVVSGHTKERLIHMKYLSSIFFCFIHIIVAGQTIEYRNDSLYINTLFVDAKTSNVKIDSLVGSKRISKSSKDDYKTNPTTGKSVIQETDFYFEKGLFFRRYDFDKNAFTVGIRLLGGENQKAKTQTGLDKSFEGELLIEGNHMNEIKKASQLTKLKNCEVIYRSLRTSSREYLMQAEIYHGNNQITIFLDEDTNEVTSIFISLNLTDK